MSVAKVRRHIQEVKIFNTDLYPDLMINSSMSWHAIHLFFQYGVVQGVMYMLLLSLSAHLTKQLGMAPGGEFRKAYNEVC